MWDKYPACVNCGTTERPHKGRGYCNKCYGPAAQLKEVNAWDRARPETLRRYPGDARHDTPRDFELLRQAYEHELQRRLDLLKHWEATRDDPADGMDLEFQLDRIASYSGAQTRGLYRNYASYIESQFPPEQRKALRELLRKLEKDRPWHGVDIYAVFEHRQNLRHPTKREA